MGAIPLVHNLKRHGRVRCDPEPLAVEQSFAEFPLNWSVSVREQNRYSYLDRLLNETVWSPESRKLDKSKDASRPPVATGFKASTAQLTRSEFSGLTSSPTVRKIVVRRANSVDAYIARIKDARTAGQTGPVKLLPRELLQYLISVDMEIKCIDYARQHSADRGAGKEWLFLNHDDLNSPDTQGEIMQRVFHHILPPSWHGMLGALAGSHSSRVKQQALRNETIANFGEVYESIKAYTERPQFLDMLMEGLEPSVVT